MNKVKRKFQGKEEPPKFVGRIPRVARLMALAIRFDEMIRNGEVKDQAELARVGRVSRARLTQIMNLLNLAPVIQEWLLFLPPVESGRGFSERELRAVVAEADWKRQSERWVGAAIDLPLQTAKTSDLSPSFSTRR